uniref:ADF-H domain-containing protein n=1 Tax=Macrostomum lignano TaxID=282301 RepID=A0A1I8IXN0_9PLAT
MRQLKIRRVLLTVTQTCLLRSDQAMLYIDVTANQSRQKQRLDLLQYPCVCSFARRLGSLPIVCLAGVRRLALGSLSNRQDAVDRIRLSIDDCANQLLVECLGADEADLEMLQSRCYELSGPTAVPASPSPVIQGTVGIEDPAEASGCSLASAVATGFPPGWIRRCQLTLWRHSCLILAGPLHCSKRHAARHLAEAMQRRAQLDGLSMRQLSHDCLDWEAFDAWLAAAGLGDDSDADDDADADDANDAGRDSAATDGGEDSPAL